ncbi:unnamed protein product [Porites evermanni]|uniref:G-protein coupled receptors family 1 profile domain-containing protein n=1 Tax=Porites evermanni TaxID=104178 RepID=A0ABN8LQV1_9CNID|nr:unnamed protein product [Porites evermanni]
MFPQFFTSILALITAVTFIGNMLIVTAFFKTPSLRTSTNYYIVSMAVSDFIGPFFIWPLYVCEGMLTSTVFIGGSSALAACKLGMYFRALSQTVSVLSLVLISVDRFVAIVFPFKFAVMNRKIRVGLLVVSWLVPLLGVLPYLIFSEITTVENRRVCRFMVRDEAKIGIHANGIALFYILPLITIVVLYSLIMIKLKQSTKNSNIQTRPQDIVGRSQQNRKILKILITIVIAFFLCWTPLSMYFVLRIFCPDLFVQDTCLLITGFTFYVFPSLSTAVNPLILFSFSTNYKQALRSLSSQVSFLCKCRCKASQPQ